MTVTLREYAKSDAERLAEILNDFDMLLNLTDMIPHPYSKADALAFITAYANLTPNVTFAVEYAGLLVGTVGFSRKSDVMRRTFDGGYYLAKTHWGKGIMPEALRQACAYIWGSTDAERIQLDIFSRNAQSRRVAEKAGFALEGVLQRAAIKRGEFLDVAMYALLR